MIDSDGEQPPISPDKLKHTLKELAAIGAHLPPVPEETYSRETLYAFEDAMDEMSEGIEKISVDPPVTYNREDIYFDDIERILGHA